MFFNKGVSGSQSSVIDNFTSKKTKGDYTRRKRINVIFASLPIAIMYQLSTMTTELRDEVGVFGTANSLSSSVLITFLYLYFMTNLAGSVISNIVNRYIKYNNKKTKSGDGFEFTVDMAQHTASKICAVTAMLSFSLFAITYAFTGAVSTVFIPILFASSVYEIKRETGIKFAQSFFSTILYLLAALISTSILSLLFVYAIMIFSSSVSR